MADDLSLINKIKNKKCIAVINKSDVSQLIDTEAIEKNFIHTVYISAKENSGINGIQNAITELFELEPERFAGVTVANERQKRCIDSCLEHINEAIDAVNSGIFLDAVNVILDDAEQNLLELTGEKITDAVVDEVFSRFCVGK